MNSSKTSGRASVRSSHRSQSSQSTRQRLICRFYKDPADPLVRTEQSGLLKLVPFAKRFLAHVAAGSAREFLTSVFNLLVVWSSQLLPSLAVWATRRDDILGKHVVCLGARKHLSDPHSHRDSGESMLLMVGLSSYYSRQSPNHVITSTYRSTPPSINRQ